MRTTLRPPGFWQGGFTLVELMVAVAVSFVLAALAAPGFVASLDKARVRGAADAVVDHVAQARQGAVMLGRDVLLSAKGIGATWCIGAVEAATPAAGSQADAPVACDCVAAPATCVVDGRHGVVGSVQHPGVGLVSESSALVFDGRLGARSDAGAADTRSFELVSATGRFALAVRVSPLGQATICSKRGNVAGYPPC